MRRRLTDAAFFVGLAAALLVVAVLGFLSADPVGAQDRFYYFNGVGYAFPATQGEAGTVLINDGTGALSWGTPPTTEGLWRGSVLLSTVACPAGWTRLSAADNRVLRGAAAAGGTGGSDTHTHTVSGTSASQAVTISGSTGSSGVTISGSTGSTSIAHTHATTTSTTTCASGGTSAVTTFSVQSGDANHSHSSGSLAGGSHSHDVGTLAGGGHTHGAGSLAADSASTLPAYYGIVLCRKD